MKNIFKSLMIVIGCLAATLLSAQTTVTWIPTQADVTALTNTSVHVVNVGSGAQSFQIYSTRPFFNNNTVKLEWDGSINAVKMTDNGLDKAGIAVYVPSSSDNISKIVVYMHTSNTRKTLYASGNPCPQSGTVTANALAKTSTAYEFWTNVTKDVYYACGGRSGGSGDSWFDKVEVTFTSGSTPTQSSDNTLNWIKYDGTDVPGFSATTYAYNVTLQAGTTNIPTVTAEKHEEHATVTITQATALPGTATIKVTAENGVVQNYTVTFAVEGTTPPVLSSDATLSGMTYGGSSVPGFSPNTYTYNIELAAGITTPPTIAGTLNDPNATMVVTQATSVPGSGNIRVTAQDGTTQLTYTINYTVPSVVPSTDLTIHVPEVYEATELAGGYGGTLSEHNGREYEVYYAGRWDNGGTKLTMHIDPVDKTHGITKNETNTAYEAIDGWFKGTGVDKGDGFSALEEFSKSSTRCHAITKSNSIEIHIQGYDQFSLYGADKKWSDTKPEDQRYLKVSIDDEDRPMTFSKDHTIRRFDITTGEHVIKITHSGSEQSLFGGFSLRVAQEPRTKWLKGNDSTQVILQTAYIKPVTYVTKYNSISGAETQLEWSGTAANGISLVKITGSLTDTLTLSGQANCAVGTYNYAVVAYYNGVETSRATGKFTVKSDIQATSSIVVDTYQNEEMDQITFNYYALSANDVSLTWPNGQPAGISGSGNNGKYIIGGTPTANPDTYPFAITVLGADTTIQGQITVKKLDYGTDPILYLYKNDMAYEQDGVYTYLNDQGKNLITRKTKNDGLRPMDQYAKYKWVLISEDVDADNPEVIQIIQGGASLPVLNLKGFTYAPSVSDPPTRLGWGEPDNGAIDTAATKEKGCSIRIEQATHPIFAKMSNVENSGKFKILSTYVQNGIMPIAINNAPNTLCLATGKTRSLENYYEEGEWQTAIHEVPAGMRGGKKYICLSMARRVTLATQGQKLIDGIVEYLLSATPSGIDAPQLEIQSFTVNGIAAKIDQGQNLITLRLTEDQFGKDMDSLRAAKPEITLANPTTHVSPEGPVDLRYMYVIPQTFVVTDYISRRAYDFYIDLYDPHQDIDQVSEAGQWINIFDIYGRKVATTNEDYRTMDLPRGMYIIVTESGQTLKIMR